MGPREAAAAAVEVRVPAVPGRGRTEVAYGRRLGGLVRFWRRDAWLGAGRDGPEGGGRGARGRSGQYGDGAQARAGGDDLLPAGAVRAQGAEPGEVQLAGDAPDVLAGTGRTWARTARVREQRR